MRIVRMTVLALIAVAIGGGAYYYRDEVSHRLGLGASATAAEKGGGASPAASAQPQGRRGRANPGGAVPVVVTTVEAKPLPVIIEAVGSVQSVSSVQLKSRIDSQLMKVHVEEGALVKEGDLLFELDSRSLKAQLGQIEAQVRKDQAQVIQAKRDVVRYEELLAKSAGTVVNRDSAQTALKSAEAQLESDEAVRQNILTQLTYTEIRAPVSGRIGSIPNKAGTTVRVADNTATSVLATINQVDPIYVQFAIPQTYLPDLRAAMSKGPVKVEAIVNDKLKQIGAMAFIENAVDAATGTVTGKARIDNSNEVLWPGQFIKAEIVLGTEQEALAVPGTAVLLGAQGPYVFVIKDGSLAEVRPITISRNQSGQAVIASGLKAGEQVVIDGQLRLVNGASVSIRQQNEAPKAPAPRG